MKLPKIKLNKEKVSSLSLKIALFLFILSLSLQVSITNKYAVKGSEMVSLIEKQQVLTKEISLLELEVSEVTSLSYIETKATQLGFVEYEAPISVISTSQFAALSDF